MPAATPSPLSAIISDKAASAHHGWQHPACRLTDTQEGKGLQIILLIPKLKPSAIKDTSRGKFVKIFFHRCPNEKQTELNMSLSFLILRLEI